MSHKPAAETHRRRWTHPLVALGLAWVVATVWGSIVQTQFNLQALVGLGTGLGTGLGPGSGVNVDMPAGVRLKTTWQDLIGFGPVYAGIVAAGWLPALTAAALLARRWPAWRSPLLTAAAGLGLVAAVRVVDAVAPMPVFIDATRSLMGLLSMSAGAALAGLLYAHMTRPTAAPGGNPTVRTTRPATRASMDPAP